MREADVRDDAVAEERADAAARAIDELIGKHQMSSGAYSSFRLPTALAERIHSTPSIFMPKMLAR